MIEMMHDDSALSAITRSMAASRGSLPIALPISSKVIPSYLRSAGSSTELSMTPAAPPEPYHWFSHGAFGSSMSRFTRARVAGSSQALQHGLGAALAHPHRQAGVEAVGRAVVGIDVGRYAQAAGARRLDAAQHLGHLSPVGLVGGLEVPDLGRDVRALGDRQHLVERLEDLVALRALVGDVDAAVRGRDLRQLDEFVRRGEPIGDVLQRRTQAEGAILHRVGHERLHPRRSPRRWRHDPPCRRRSRARRPSRRRCRR